MNILNITKNMVADFAREEEGAQVVEYALVIALVSIVLALALAQFAGTTPFETLATRVTACLSGATGCAAA
jgi:pilus assembly protein Flp/PilA